MGIDRSVIDFYKRSVPGAFITGIPANITRVLVDMNACMRKLPPCRSMLSDSANVIDYNYRMTLDELSQRFNKFILNMAHRYPDALTFALVYDKKSPIMKKREQIKRVKSRNASDAKRGVESVPFPGIEKADEKCFTINELMSAGYTKRVDVFAYLATRSQKIVDSLESKGGRGITLIHDHAMNKNPIIINANPAIGDTPAKWKNGVFEGEVACVMHSMTKWKYTGNTMETIAVESIDTDTPVIALVNILRVVDEDHTNSGGTRTRCIRRSTTVYADDDTSDDNDTPPPNKRRRRPTRSKRSIIWVRSVPRQREYECMDLTVFAHEMHAKFIKQAHGNVNTLIASLYTASVVCKNDFCPTIKSKLTNRINATHVITNVFRICLGSSSAQFEGITCRASRLADILIEINPRLQSCFQRSTKTTKKGAPTAAATKAQSTYDAGTNGIRCAADTIQPLLLALARYWSTFHITR